jgi:TamB, inner membrane protein subunit of TAM complex/AsmA family
MPDEPSPSSETTSLPDHPASPAPAPRRRVPRWVIIIAAVTALALLGLFAAQVRLTQIASRSIQAALSEELGLPVSLEGLTLQWFPAAVTLQQMRIGDPREPAPLLTTSSVEVRFSLFSLLADQIVIHHIAVETPQLELNNDRIERIIRPVRPHGEAAAVIIRQITLHNGTVRYTDTGKQVRAVIEQLGGTIDLGLLIKRATITLTDGRVLLERGAWHQTFASIRGRAAWTPSRLTVQRLSVDGSEGHLALDGAVELDAARSVQLTVTASLPLSQLKPWLPAGYVWDGALGLEAKIAGPWTPEPDLGHLVAPLSLSGRLNVDHLTIDTVPIGTATALWQWHQGRLTLSHVTGALLSGSIDGHATASFPPSPPAIDAAFDLTGLQVGPPLRRFMPLADLPDWRLSGHLAVRGDGWSLDHLGGEGHLTIAAIETDRPLSLASTLPPIPLREALRRISRITADGQWHAAQFTFRRAEVVSRQGNHATIQGTVAYHGPMALSGSWQLADLSEIGDWAAAAGINDLEGWTGAAAGHAAATGSWDQPRLAGSLTVHALGRYGESIDEGRATFSYEAETLTWHDGHLRQGAGAAAVNGTMTFPPTRPNAAPAGRAAAAPARFRASIAVTHGELGRILRLFDVTVPIDGRADGTFTLEGSSKAFHLRGPVHVADGRLYGQPVAGSDLTIDLTSDGIAFPRVVLTEGDGVLRGSGRIDFNGAYQTALTVERFSLESLQRLHAIVPQLSGTLSGSLSGSGTWKDPHADGRIELSGLAAGASVLGRGVITVRVAGEQLDITAEFQDPHLSAEGTVTMRDAFPATLRWRATQFPIVLLLRPFLPAWPDEVTLTASGEGEFAGRFTGPADLHGRVVFSTLSARLADYPIGNDGPIEFEIQNGRIDVHRARFTGEGTRLAVEGSLTPFERYDLFIHGEAELAILRLFFPRVSYGKGKGYLALQITDRWLDPAMAGGISIQDGLIRLEAVDQPFTIAYAGLVFDGQQLVLDDLHGGIGKGTVQASGRITLHGLRPAAYRVLMEVSDVPIAPIEGLSGTVDGALWLQGELAGSEPVETGRYLLKGDLQLVRATYSKRINLKTILKEQPTFDAVKLSLPSFLNSVALQIHLWGHQAIWIRNNIAILPLDIDLEVRGTVEHPVIVGRIFTSGGTFTFLHTPFRVSQGSIDFLDPKQTRPVIDLKASALVRNYEIDLALTGTPERVDLELSSDPALSQADILSVMTVGRTSEEVSTVGAGAVATSEAAALLVDELLEEPAQQFGIDRFQIDAAVDRSGLTVGPQLTIGKAFLDDRLLFLYSQPLDPTTVQQYRLEYEFNRHMSVVGEGDDSGRLSGDIKFRFDFR